MLHRLRSTLAALFRRGRFETGMDDEMRFHMDAYAGDLVRAGIPPAEAARRARLEFGGVQRVMEECRQAWGLRLVDELRQDVRYAVRSMRKALGFTAVAILSLALGIGANTAIFSLMDAVIFRTLPLRDPAQLFFLAHDPGPDGADLSSNYPLFERYKGAEVFSGVTAYASQPLRVTTPEGIQPVTGQFVSGNYHALLGVPIALGRGFSSEPDRETGRSSIAVISDGYWARAFGRAPDVIGKTLTIRGRPAAIVGVTASGFYGFEPGSHVDITLPMSVRALDDAQFLDDHGGWTGMRIVGRLKVGESQALAAVDALFQQYMVEPENRWARDAGSTHFKSAALVPAARGDQDLRLRYATALTVLMAMVGVVLLIACANVANLQLARAAARAKEIAVRASIGASRRRLVRQLLTESFLLACCGGALGLLVAVWSTSVILALFETGQNPVLIDVTLNIRVLAFTTAVSVLTGVAFGLVPAFRATRVDLTPALKESGDIATRGRRSTVATTLVVTQIALCVLVISTAGLLVRSLRNLRSLDTGFARHKVLLFNLDLAGPAFSPDRRHTFYADLLDRLRGLPGVESVSSSTRSPIDDTRVLRRIDVPGFQSTERHGVSTNVVTPGYFQTFGMRLIRGRGFGAEDRPATPRVAVVGESMARFYFGQSDPIGRTFVLGGEKDATTIVGVVQDVRHERMREAPPKMVYTLLAQSASVVTFGGGSAVPQRVSVAIRSQGTPGGLAASVGTEVRGLSRDAMVSYVRTMEQQVDAALVRERVLASLSTGFGLLALALACVGLYGVMSYSVARRGREIGIRIALGASRMTVLQQILRETLAVALAGVALGLGAALAATQIVSRFLFELTPRDPLTLAMAASLLLLTTAVAGFLPARRAAHVDPMQALRAD